jgi:hypothetical protein
MTLIRISPALGSGTGNSLITSLASFASQTANLQVFGMAILTENGGSGRSIEFRMKLQEMAAGRGREWIAELYLPAKRITV